MRAEGDPLALFHPRIARWFRERHGDPTDVQARSWPLIAAGDHVLATAPTGSGKTLCAFLAPLDRLLTGAWTPGTVRVLYVSPLKALNNDIQRNLLAPLAELEALWRADGETPPQIRVATRSGDTRAEARRRMLRDPPEILVTTPESLNILLTSAGGRRMLGGVRMLILDEIHAVAGGRRGTWLMSGVEALAEQAGEFQRIALSATVRPLDAVADLVGGHAWGPDGVPLARPRPVRRVRSTQRRRLEIRIEALDPDLLPGDGGLDALGPIARSIVAATTRNRSTLVFTNSRALCEKLAYRINEAADGSTRTPLAWAHHGSLSRELRLEVEARLKAGELRAIVATSSLELGIDIGELDEVVMVQAPPSVSAAVQRAGRAGHQVGATSRATLHPTHPHDLLEAAAVVHAALEGNVEPTVVPHGCLDVLAQVLVARLAAGAEEPDRLFQRIRCATPFHDLPRAHFDLVLAMLAGRYADSRVRELRPRILADPQSGRLTLQRGALLALYGSGGVIPDRGYYQLRHAETAAKIGELDEEFVWESGPGQAFSLGSQPWRVQRITHNDVFVTPAPDARHAPPFWRAEERDRDPHLSAQLRALMSDWDATLGPATDGPALDAALAESLPLDAKARTELVSYLVRQREATGAPLPHARHLLVERVRASGTGARRIGDQLVLHTLAGRRLNRPWALALEAAWQARFGERPEIFTANDAIVVQLGGEIAPEALLELVTPDEVEARVRERLEGSGLFGARFRECAGRALLFTRQRFGERMPLWMSRLQSQKLMARVRGYGEFPMLLEAWRSCLTEDLDLVGLRRYLEGLASGEIAVSLVTTGSPSPFAAHLGWEQINRYMYADDTPRDRGAPGSGLSASLLDTVLHDDRVRPQVRRDTVTEDLQRRRRLVEGWGPVDETELQHWLRERRLMDPDEFARHAAAIEDEQGGTGAKSGGPPWCCTLHRADQRWLLHEADAAHAARLFPDCTLDRVVDAAPLEDPDATRLAWLRDWLAFQPPLTEAELARAWPGPVDALRVELSILEDEQQLLRGAVIEGDPAERFVDADTLEAMLRRQRAAARRQVNTLPEARVAEFLLAWQRVGEDLDDLDAFEALRALPLPAEAWEGWVLPARLAEPGRALDALLADGALVFYGHGTARIAFATLDDIEEVPRRAPSGADRASVEALLPDADAHYPFSALRARCADDGQQAAERLWRGVWQGAVTADSFAPVRLGARQHWALPQLATDADVFGTRPAPRRRGSLRARVNARIAGYPGHFFRLPPITGTEGAIDALERARRQARIVLDRWGVVTPALLRREVPGLRWRDLSRALRLMELAGEITSGLFLDGLDGPQFASAEALELVMRLAVGPVDPAAPPLRCFDARDPASPCGLGLAPPGLPLPARRAGTLLVMGGARVLFVATRSGRSLALDPALDATTREAAIACWARALTRRSAGRIEVEEIDGAPARSSPLAAILAQHFEVGADHRTLTLTTRGNQATAD
jgi:ATP-dependent Lhr-like helicase